MAVTRPQVEMILLSRAAKRMAFVEMDHVTKDGTNPDLNDPIATALQRMGVTPADITNIADSDLTGVENVLQLLDLAELRLLENIRGNTDTVDLRIGDRDEKLSQFLAGLDTAIQQKAEYLSAEYGIGLGSLDAGSLSLDFQAKHDDDFTEETE